MAVRRLAALVLFYCFLPGAGEIPESAVHLVQHGHLAHAAICSEGPESPMNDPEHGCTTTFHVCSCHGAPIFLMPSKDDVLLPAQKTAEFGVSPSRPADVMASGIFRPPRAA